MATRTIRTIGDDVLTKVCKEVKEVTPKTKELIDDMFETMYDQFHVDFCFSAPSHTMQQINRLIFLIPLF